MPSDDAIHGLLDFLFAKKALAKVNSQDSPMPAPPPAPANAQTELMKAIAANPNNDAAKRVMQAPRKPKVGSIVPPVGQ